RDIAMNAATLNPSIVHVNGFDRPRLVRSIRRRAPRTAAVAVQDHGGLDPVALSPMRRAWLRDGLATANVVLVATPPQAEAFRPSGLVRASIGIRDVMEGSTTLRAPDRRADRGGPLSVLWVGRLIADKDPITVVEGFARFAEHRRDAHMTFVYGDA